MRKVIYDGLNERIVDELVFTGFVSNQFCSAIVLAGRMQLSEGFYKIFSLPYYGITLKYWCASDNKKVNITAFGREEKIGEVENIISKEFPKSS